MSRPPERSQKLTVCVRVPRRQRGFAVFGVATLLLAVLALVALNTNESQGILEEADQVGSIHPLSSSSCLPMDPHPISLFLTTCPAIRCAALEQRRDTTTQSQTTRALTHHRTHTLQQFRSLISTCFTMAAAAAAK